jgi:glycosyltransferase involved in cell wall biosynthesis
VNAVVWLLENPLEAMKMGERGKQAIVDKYSWENESDKLVGLYSRILGSDCIKTVAR